LIRNPKGIQQKYRKGMMKSVIGAANVIGGGCSNSGGSSTTNASLVNRDQASTTMTTTTLTTFVIASLSCMFRLKIQ
jgi:hypothetical protein